MSIMKSVVDPAEIVEDGYDDIARTYHERRDKFKSKELLTGFSSLLKPGGNVLDVGCGAGVPVARFLVDAGFTVRISEVQEHGGEKHCWVMAEKSPS